MRGGANHLATKQTASCGAVEWWDGAVRLQPPKKKSVLLLVGFHCSPRGGDGHLASLGAKS